MKVIEILKEPVEKSTQNFLKILSKHLLYDLLILQNFNFDA